MYMRMCQNNNDSHMKTLQTIAAEATVTGTVKRRKLADEAVAKARPTIVAPVAAASASCDTLLQVAEVQRSKASRGKVELGPRKAAEALAASLLSSDDAGAWVKRARTEAVVLSAPHSLRSVQSGVRAWGHFADRVLRAGGRHLPPSPEGLAAWSRLFRRAGTFANYVGYVALACDIAGVSAEATRSPLVKRAKAALKKEQKAPRERRFIDGALTARLFAATVEHDTALAMLYLFAYTFLLRVPSEALLAQVGSFSEDGEGVLPTGLRSRAGLRGGELVLQLARRKNRPHGSTLVRGCWCSSCGTTCPAHVLGPWLASFPAGGRQFAHLTAKAARDGLKLRLAQLKVSHANEYWLHDFRRGHTQELLSSGSSLAVILRAGEWKTPAFMCYLDMQSLEKEAVVQAHQVESDSDSDGG